MAGSQFDFVYDELRPAANAAFRARWPDVGHELTVGVDGELAQVHVEWIDGPTPAAVLDGLGLPAAATITVELAGRTWSREVELVQLTRHAGPRLWLAALVEYERRFGCVWKPDWVAGDADTPGCRQHGFCHLPDLCDTIDLTGDAPVGDERWPILETLAADAGLLASIPPGGSRHSVGVAVEVAAFVAEALPAVSSVLERRG